MNEFGGPAPGRAQLLLPLGPRYSSASAPPGRGKSAGLKLREKNVKVAPASAPDMPTVTFLPRLYSKMNMNRNRCNPLKTNDPCTLYSKIKRAFARALGGTDTVCAPTTSHDPGISTPAQGKCFFSPVSLPPYLPVSVLPFLATRHFPLATGSFYSTMNPNRNRPNSLKTSGRCTVYSTINRWVSERLLDPATRSCQNSINADAAGPGGTSKPVSAPVRAHLCSLRRFYGKQGSSARDSGPDSSVSRQRCGNGAYRIAKAHQRNTMARTGNGGGCDAGRAAGNDSGARPLLGLGLRLA